MARQRWQVETRKSSQIPNFLHDLSARNIQATYKETLSQESGITVFLLLVSGDDAALNGAKKDGPKMGFNISNYTPPPAPERTSPYKLYLFKTNQDTEWLARFVVEGKETFNWRGPIHGDRLTDSQLSSISGMLRSVKVPNSYIEGLLKMARTQRRNQVSRAP